VWSDCIKSVCVLLDECQLSLVSKLMTNIVNKAVKTTRAACMDAKRYEVYHFTDSIYSRLILQTSLLSQHFNVSCKYTDVQPLINKHNHENCYSLRMLNPLGNAVWCKISSITSSFAKCKLIWICRLQNHLTMGHFVRREYVMKTVFWIFNFSEHFSGQLMYLTQ